MRNPKLRIFFPNPAPQATNTFQAVLLTDGVHSFVFFHYADMDWDPALLGNGHVISGFTDGLGQATYINVSAAGRYRPDLEAGNYGAPGAWSYRLDLNAPGSVSPRRLCYDWSEAEAEEGVYEGLLNASLASRNVCPCNLAFMEYDKRFIRAETPDIQPTASPLNSGKHPLLP